MASKIQFRRGLAASWSTINPILFSGEPGMETDTGKMKLGNGVDAWNDLEYLIGEAVDGGGTLTPGSVTNIHVATNAAISADKLADGGTNKVFTAAEKAKLGGVQTGATLNSTDAFLRARSNHTGFQAISTVTLLQESLDEKADVAEIASQISVSVANTPIYWQHNGTSVPPRPATTRPVHWFVPASINLPVTGTTAGGTVAAVNNLDIITEY